MWLKTISIFSMRLRVKQLKFLLKCRVKSVHVCRVKGAEQIICVSDLRWKLKIILLIDMYERGSFKKVLFSILNKSQTGSPTWDDREHQIYLQKGFPLWSWWWPWVSVHSGQCWWCWACCAGNVSYLTLSGNSMQPGCWQDWGAPQLLLPASLNVNPVQGAGAKSAIIPTLKYVHKGREGEKEIGRLEASAPLDRTGKGLWHPVGVLMYAHVCVFGGIRLYPVCMYIHARVPVWGWSQWHTSLWEAHHTTDDPVGWWWPF